MQAQMSQLDAFTTRRFAGNPAAVMVMEACPADHVMQAIGAEINAETAFVARDNGDVFFFDGLAEY
jgi:predicted PhzF superfamily epimerase YddE/YHI9